MEDCFKYYEILGGCKRKTLAYKEIWWNWTSGPKYPGIKELEQIGSLCIWERPLTASLIFCSMNRNKEMNNWMGESREEFRDWQVDSLPSLTLIGKMSPSWTGKWVCRIAITAASALFSNRMNVETSETSEAKKRLNSAVLVVFVRVCRRVFGNWISEREEGVSDACRDTIPRKRRWKSNPSSIDLAWPIFACIIGRFQWLSFGLDILVSRFSDAQQRRTNV